MKKIFLVVAVVGIAAFSFSSCGNGTKTAENTEAVSEVVEVVDSVATEVVEVVDSTAIEVVEETVE